MNKYVLIISSILFLQACTVAVPVNQMMGPQTLGKGVEFGYIAALAPAIGEVQIEGDSSVVSTVNNITADFNELDVVHGGRLAFSLMKNVDIEGEILGGYWDSRKKVLSLGTKIQLMGNSLFESKRGDTNAAIRAKYFRSSQSNNFTFSNIVVDRIQLNGYELAISAGHMLANSFQVYGGAQYLNSRLKYEFDEEGATSTILQENRDVAAYGPFLGFMFSPSMEEKFRMSYSLEWQYTSFPDAFGNDRVWSSSYAASTTFSFGF